LKLLATAGHSQHGQASETILALRPVTLRHKPDPDPDSVSQFGPVAEEVKKVDPALVVRDPESDSRKTGEAN
jgi:Chaperone of endosialidase